MSCVYRDSAVAESLKTTYKFRTCSFFLYWDILITVKMRES